MENLHIVSWNVAAWSTTLEKIKLRHGSLEIWMNKHSIDILCVQEAKISKAELCFKARDLGALGLPHFASFWAFPAVQSSKGSGNGSSQGKGWNGVATFARAGITCSANASPLGVAELDSEGRCLLTDHGSFVIINVYIPNNGSGNRRYPIKVKFLRALRELVIAQKAVGKRVILLGDFNIAPRAVDVTMCLRRINLNDIQLFSSAYGQGGIIDLFATTTQRYFQPAESTEFLSAVHNLVKAWPTIANDLRQTVIEKTNGKFQVSTIRSTDGKQIRLGSATVYHPYHSFCIEEKFVSDEGTGEEFLVKKADEMPMEELREAYRLLRPVNSPNISNAQWNLLTEYFGKPHQCESSVHWFESLLTEENMVDSFATSRPGALYSRFTCWDQSTNRRYTNDGSRIDHIVIDKDWWESSGLLGRDLSGVNSSLPEGASACVGPPDISSSSATSAEVELKAALHACTAGGKFVPAPMSGGGIPEAHASAYEAQFELPHTGIIYTPPEYSDHVAVSILLKLPEDLCTLQESINLDTASGRWKEVSKDSKTSETQPFLKQSSIKSHFLKASLAPIVEKAAIVSTSPPTRDDSPEQTQCTSVAVSKPVATFFPVKSTTTTGSNLKRKANTAPVTTKKPIASFFRVQSSS